MTIRAIALAALLATGIGGAAMAETPTKEQTASLSWMLGTRVHTNADGSKVYEAFIGPMNGVVTGTAVSAIGADRAFTEYHRIGPNAEGVYGLDVANTRSGMKWNFTPLKSIEPGKITFQTADGTLTISYAHNAEDGIDARVDRKADGKTTTQEWHFKAVK